MFEEIEGDFRDRINLLIYNIYLRKWSMRQAQSKTHYGRINFNVDFQDILNEDWQMIQKRDIDVFVCSSKVLVKELQCLCIKINDYHSSINRVHLYLNKENFQI
ncbi:unnamed protein product [Rotaria sp. Silwood2]|nr:unnamed protein product [Rotaria sp. Silwood2]CAF3479155.1 unnamed protein product [Rotaria sp. Silwood2]CAF4662585.1 unnamed protein product [Rotaria sp. Silwood2]